jgi:hypothetical protein
VSETGPPGEAWPRWNRAAFAAFVAGHVLVAAAGVAGTQLVVAEAALLVPLVATLVAGGDRVPAVAGFVLGGTLLGLGFASALAWFGPYWQVAGGTLVGTGLLLYGVHRYELITLDLTTGTEDTP